MNVLIVLFVLLSTPILGLAQSSVREPVLAKDKKYISLNMLDSLYEVNRFTLNTRELYGVDETIELYNVKVVGIALFSVLPDFTCETNWEELPFEAIKDLLISDREFNRLVRGADLSRASKTKSMEFSLVKEDNGRYWVSRVCLLELFGPNNYTSDHYPSIFNVRQGTLNTKQSLIGIGEMKTVFEDEMDWPFPLDIRGGGMTILPNRHELEREYLSQVSYIGGLQAFQFWILSDWSAGGSYSFHRGIDRLVYIPEKGIVGGSFDFYFLADLDRGWPGAVLDLRPRHRKTREELWQNVIHEKVMLAEELR